MVAVGPTGSSSMRGSRALYGLARDGPVDNWGVLQRAGSRQAWPQVGCVDKQAIQRSGTVLRHRSRQRRVERTHTENHNSLALGTARYGGIIHRACSVVVVDSP